MATQAEVAKALGITQGRVSQLIKQGILPPSDRGDHSISACVRLYEEWQDHLEDCAELGVANRDVFVYWFEKQANRAWLARG